MKPYAELSELGRARRLRPLVEKALVEYELDPIRVRLLSNEFNGVFRIDTADGPPVVLRVVLPSGGHQPSHVEAEATFLEAIAAAGVVPAPAPIRNRHGRLVTWSEAEGVPEPRMCVVTSWVPGVDLAERMTTEAWRRLGALAATLHRFASRWTPPAGFETIVYDRVVHFGEPVVLFERSADPYLTTPQRRVLEAALALLDARIAALPGRRIVVHGDLHQWNVRVSRGRLHPIDFEDLQWAHPIQDVGTTFYYIWRRDDREELIAAFRAGYCTVGEWVETHPGELDLYVAARGVDLVNFVLFSPDEDAADHAELIGRVVRMADRVRGM